MRERLAGQGRRLPRRGGGVREVTRDQQALVEHHPVRLRGGGEALLALLQQEALHLAQRERGDEGERHEGRQHEEQEQAPRDVALLHAAQARDHGSKSAARPMNPPSRARTTSSRLFALVSCAAVSPSAPTLYKS